MKIVFASHTFFSPVFVVGSHHLARMAARANHQVWHVSSAVSLLHLPFAALNSDYRHRARLACSSGRSIEPGLWESVPLTLAPWAAFRRLRQPERAYLRGFRSVPRAAARLGFERPDLLLIDEPRMGALVSALRPRVTIYRPTDMYSALKADPTLVGVERRLLGRVDGVVATSKPVLDHVSRLRQGVPSLLLENGVDVAHFSTPRPEPEELRGIPHPRAIYVGALDQRFDGELLTAAALANPGTRFVVVGGQAPTGARAAPAIANVSYLGRRPYRDVPAYLQHCDFAVMPLSPILANEGRSPMKIFEFGAAGLPVVASATAELTRRALPFVSLASTRTEFAEACSRAAHLGNGDVQRLARASAAEHAWGAKLERLLTFAAQLPGGPSALRQVG